MLSEALDLEGRLVGFGTQQGPLLRRGQNRGDALPPSVGAATAAPLELVVERRVAEVGVEQGAAQVARKPSRVESKGFVVGEADTPQSEQLDIDIEAEPGRHVGVGRQGDVDGFTALHDPRGLDRGEQAVERTEALLELGALHHGAPSPNPAQEALGLETPDRFPDRVPADVVTSREFEIGGEPVVVLTAGKPAAQHCLELRPQRQVARSVESRGVHGYRPHPIGVAGVESATPAWERDPMSAPSPAHLTVDDRIELSDLVARYAVAVDNRDFDALHAVFVRDATLDTGRSTRSGFDEIVEAMQGLLRYEATAHVLGQHLVEATGTGASGLVYCTAHHLTDHGEHRTDKVMHIRYHDVYVRTDHGWRMTARRLEVAWTDEQPVDSAS